MNWDYDLLVVVHWLYLMYLIVPLVTHIMFQSDNHSLKRCSRTGTRYRGSRTNYDVDSLLQIPLWVISHYDQFNCVIIQICEH